MLTNIFSRLRNNATDNNYLVNKECNDTEIELTPLTQKGTPPCYGSTIFLKTKESLKKSISNLCPSADDRHQEKLNLLNK